MTKDIKLCLIGFGNAGRAFCKILEQKKKEIDEKYGFNPVVTAIATKTKGNLLNTTGLDLALTLQELEEQNSFTKNNPFLIEGDSLDIINKSGAQVLIELSTLSITREQPAIRHIEEAFANKMHVITANKGPIAWDYQRLKDSASSKNLNFLFETTVMDGTPVFNLVKHTLPGCKIKGFKGILNSTTNFLLEEMAKGIEYETAIKEAQRRGFAEADPTFDTDGWDAAFKTAALINALMDGNISPLEIERAGISHIDKATVLKAKAEGKKIKLLCEGYRVEGKVMGKVHPVSLDRGHIFSTIDATSSILELDTDLAGQICIVEKDPEIEQTAYGIYSDFLSLLTELSFRS